MKQLEITWSRSIRVWWSYFWRATVFGALASLVLAGLAAYLVVWFGYPGLSGKVGAAAGYLATIPVSMLCIRLILGRSFAGYRVQLVAEDSQSGG